MPSSRPTQCSGSSSRARQTSRARILAQTTLDAELNAEYEVSGDSFDYSKLVEAQRTTPPEQGRSEKVIACLQHIQRGKPIQPFGCLLALDEKSFKVIAFSDNAPEMLATVSHAVPSVDDPPKLGIGTLFRVLRPSCHPWFDPPSLSRSLNMHHPRIALLLRLQKNPARTQESATSSKHCDKEFATT